jgi:siroheme synthase-like protein
VSEQNLDPLEPFYPVFLDLRGRSCLVVGGGPVAAAKVRALLDAGAAVTVVSPDAADPLPDWAAAGRIRWLERRFREDDVAGRMLVIAATDDLAVNAAVYACADRVGVFANAVDDLDHCSFIAPAVARRGQLQVAVSTAGSSPALAKRIRDRIATDVLGEEEAALAELVGAWRPRVKTALAGYNRRQRFWEGVLESCVPELVASGRTGRAEAALAEAVRRAGTAGANRGCVADVGRPGSCPACRSGWR